jgi:hypothetical protein
MPRYLVMETRSYKIFTVVEAPSEQEAAKVGDYMAFDTIETDSEGKDVEVLEQLEDDVEFVPEGWI